MNFHTCKDFIGPPVFRRTGEKKPKKTRTAKVSPPSRTFQKGESDDFWEENGRTSRRSSYSAPRNS